MFCGILLLIGAAMSQRKLTSACATHLHGDTALASCVGDAAGKADVALVTPEVAPGVLYNPVVRAVLRACAICGKAQLTGAAQLQHNGLEIASCTMH